MTILKSRIPQIQISDSLAVTVKPLWMYSNDLRSSQIAPFQSVALIHSISEDLVCSHFSVGKGHRRQTDSSRELPDSLRSSPQTNKGELNFLNCLNFPDLKTQI
jgi:hypothetical protein